MFRNKRYNKGFNFMEAKAEWFHERRLKARETHHDLAILDIEEDFQRVDREELGGTEMERKIAAYAYFAGRMDELYKQHRKNNTMKEETNNILGYHAQIKITPCRSKEEYERLGEGAEETTNPIIRIGNKDYLQIKVPDNPNETTRFTVHPSTHIREIEILPDGSLGITMSHEYEYNKMLREKNAQIDRLNLKIRQLTETKMECPADEHEAFEMCNHHFEVDKTILHEGGLLEVVPKQ